MVFGLSRGALAGFKEGLYAFFGLARVFGLARGAVRWRGVWSDCMLRCLRVFSD